MRRELLFAVGDPYDPELLEETERNLRRLPFVRKAEVEAVADSSGAPKIMVRVYDAWTLEPVAHFKRAGGVTTTRFGLEERNAFGYGKTLSAHYGSSGGTPERSFTWRDPQFLGRRLEYDLRAADVGGSRRYGLSLLRPFYATIARVSAGATAHHIDDKVSVYEDESLIGEARRRATATTAFVGYAFESTPRRSRRLTLGVEHLHEDFDAVEGGRASPPQDERLTFLRLGGEVILTDFLKTRRVRKMSRLEDINLGWEFLPGFAWAPGINALRATHDRVQPRLSVQKGWRLGGDAFVIGRQSYSSTYVNGGNGARILGLDAQAYYQPGPRHTLALHAGFEHGWRLPPESPLTLGEDSGLRGYGAGQFQGDQRVVLNLEDRVFFAENVWKLLDLGGVVFADAGYVFPRRETLRLSGLRKSVGVGLRLAAHRSSANDPIRVDLARALDDNGRSTRWTVSILAGHAF